jgi:hypothetical protein
VPTHCKPPSLPLYPEALTHPFRKHRIKNKHGLRPIDLLPPPPPPSRTPAAAAAADQVEPQGTEAVRAALRRAEAEFVMTSGGPGNDDIASGEWVLVFGVVGDGLTGGLV